MLAKLTKRTIDDAEWGPKDAFLWDVELKGFGVKITPKDKRVFIVQYRAPNQSRARRRMTLGACNVLTVDQARDSAIRILGRVAGGEDPAADASKRRRAAKEATVELLSAAYLADVQGKVKQRTHDEYARIFKAHIIPAFGRKPMADVELNDVASLHSAQRKHPYQANRILNLCAAFLHWAETRGYRARGSNPCPDVKRYPERERERFLSVEEIGKLGTALTRAELQGLASAPNLRRKPKKPEKAKHRPKSADMPIPANPFAVAAIRFLLLTGWREQEALTLKWASVDLVAGRATLLDTKTGKHHFPLGMPAVALLNALPHLQGSPYVFPGLKVGAPLQEIRRVWSAVRHAADLDDVRLNDLRHTHASFGIGTGLSLYIVGKLLGHRRAETTRRYAHLADDARKAAADTVAGALAAALAGAPPADVLPMPPVSRGA